MSTSSPFYAGLGRLVIGWPQAPEHRSRVLRAGSRETVGFVRRSVREAPANQWFAERRDGSPIEGQYRTRKLALDALVADLRSEGGLP